MTSSATSGAGMGPIASMGEMGAPPSPALMCLPSLGLPQIDCTPLQSDRDEYDGSVSPSHPLPSDAGGLSADADGEPASAEAMAEAGEAITSLAAYQRERAKLSQQIGAAQEALAGQQIGVDSLPRVLEAQQARSQLAEHQAQQQALQRQAVQHHLDACWAQSQEQQLQQQQQQYGGWQQQEDWWSSDQQELPAGTSLPYGASAFNNGVWKKGNQLFFGPVTGGNLVTIKPGTNWDGWTSGCYGQLAHNISGSARNKWCTTPVECWARAGFDAHDRPDGVTIEPDQCKAAPKPFDIAGWKKVFPPPGTKVGSTSNGGKGAGGKGGGKHGKGGKGKGGKGGKGRARRLAAQSPSRRISAGSALRSA